MARAQLNYLVTTSSGAAIQIANNATVTVRKASDNSLATLYAGMTGVLTVSNPVTVDASGRVSAWLDFGKYLLTIEGPTFTSYSEYWESVPTEQLLDNGIADVLPRLEAVESESIDACSPPYSATPGPVSDQGVAIQAAIDQANANYVAGVGPTRVRFGHRGTYYLTLKAHPTTTVWAAGIVMRAGVTLDLEGVTLKLVDNATLPTVLIQQGYLVSNVYTPPGNSGVLTGRFVIRNGILDGNGANQLTTLTPAGGQFNGALFAALHLNRADRPLIEGVKAQNVWGNSPAPPVGAAPGGESFCFMTFRCNRATFINCEATGEGIDAATGWNDTYGTGTTHLDCIAHHFKYAMGFSAYQVSHARYVGCWAYSCEQRNGFNLERSDHVTYTACISGGRLSSQDDPSVFPYGYSANRAALGSFRGWSITGGYMVTLDSSCQSAFNTTNVYVDRNTVNWTRVSNRVSIFGTHLHSGSGSNRWSDNVAVDGNTITASSFTATTVSTSKTLTSVVAGTGTIVAGQEISGTGIPAGAIIDYYDSVAGTITMSTPASASGAGVAITGISDVYMYAKASTSNGIANTIGFTEAGGSLIKEFMNFASGSGSGVRMQAGPTGFSGWAFRYYGLAGGVGPGLGVTAFNQTYTSGRVRKRTAVINNYSIVSQDDIVAVTTTALARVLTLPVGSVAGEQGAADFEIVDESQGAATNNITVQRAGADTFLGGATSKVINTNGGGLRIYWNGTVWVARAITAIV